MAALRLLFGWFVTLCSSFQTMRERMIATQIAFARDMFQYYGTFYAIACVGLGGAAVARRTPFPAFPLVPLGFVVAYQYDMAYGDKMERVVAEADDILRNESHLLAMPGGALTMESIDAAAAARTARATNGTRQLG